MILSICYFNNYIHNMIMLCSLIKEINILLLMTHLSTYIDTHYKNAHNHTNKNGVTHVKTSYVYVSMCSNRNASIY